MKRIASHLVLPLALAFAFASARFAQGQEVDVDIEGRTVRVGPDKGAGTDVEVQAPGTRVRVRAAQPNPGQRLEPGATPVEVEEEQLGVDAPAPVPASYWIGIVGGDVSPELRAHLGLEAVGVIVQEVVPESPADVAGMKQHDILISANGKAITEMGDLVSMVRSAGTEKAAIEVKLIRSGVQQTVAVTPAERPAEPGPIAGVIQGLEEEPAAGLLEGLFGGRRGQPLRMRLFGPGGVLGNARVQVQGGGVDNLSVSVTTTNGQTRVKVQRGDETWDIDASDPQALEDLPADIRVLVDGVMNGGGAGGLNIDVDALMPDLDGGVGPDGAINRRIRAIQRLQEALLGGPAEAAPAMEAAPDFESAPVAPQSGPVEVEIPAEALED